MEALAGLAVFGIACNIMQTIHFSLEACAVCKRVWQGKSPAPELDSQRAAVQKAANDLQQSIVSSSQTQGQPAETELQKIANDIVPIAKKLEKELNNCKSSAIKYLVVKKHRINKISESLRSLQGVMELRILIGLREKLVSQHAFLEQRLGDIDQQTQNFIRQLESGNTRLELLIDRTSGEIRPVIEREAEATRAQAKANTQAIQNLVTGESSDTRVCFKSTFNDHKSAEVQANQIGVLLDSLRYPDMNARRNASAINNNHEGTYQWIFEDNMEQGKWAEFRDWFRLRSHKKMVQQRKWDDFHEWLRSHEKVYWISGKPGSGKSSLMRQLIDDKRTTYYLRQWKGGATVVPAFIWNAGSNMQRSQIGLLATLLHQLFFNDKSAAATYLRESTSSISKRAISDWSKAELLQALKFIFSTQPLAACLFIDGLDEIDPKEHNGAFGLLDILEDLSTLPHVKMCLGSREEPIFRTRLTRYPRLRLQDLTRNDICRYVEDSLDQNLKAVSFQSITEEQLHNLRFSVVDRADGVFLWVYLVTKSIRNGLIVCDDWESLTSRVSILPQDLSELYAEMFKRRNTDDQQLHQAETAIYFNFTLSEQKDPSLFRAALVSKPSLLRSFLSGGTEIKESYVFQQCQIARQRILANCVGLLEVSDLKDDDILTPYTRLTFMHRTARDFLTDTQAGKDILSYDARTSTERACTSFTSSMVECACTGYETAEGTGKPQDDFRLYMIMRSLENSHSTYLTSPVWTQASVHLSTLDLASSFLKRQFSTTVIDKEMLDFAVATGSKRFLVRFIQSLSSTCSSDILEWKSKILNLALAKSSSDIQKWKSKLPVFASVKRLRKSPEQIPVIQASLITWLLHEGADPEFAPNAVNLFSLLPSVYEPTFISFLRQLRNILVEKITVSTVSINTWMKLACVFLEHGADIHSRSLQRVMGSAVKFCGDISEQWPFPEWFNNANTAGCSVTVLVEMNVCQIFRGLEKELEEWIEWCDQDESRKQILRLLLNGCEHEPDKIVLIVHELSRREKYYGTHYYSPASDLPEEKVVRKPRWWTKRLPFSIVQVDPIERLITLGYLPQEAATHDTERVLGPSRPNLRSTGMKFSGIDWSYKPEYDNFLEAMKRLESSKPTKKSRRRRR